MNIKELIDKLKEHDEKLSIIICGYEDGYDDLQSVTTMKIERNVNDYGFCGDHEEDINGEKVILLN